MKKAALVFGLLIAVTAAIAAPLFAQGPFADVPTDHWAYEAVNQLQQDGILIGYPDGTFGGKRAMTRYEFAVAIARMIPVLEKRFQPTTTPAPAVDLSNYVTKSELQNAVANLATKSDVEALRRLVDEFRDELAALGVDVDALKRDVASLNDRVCALEKEMNRVKWNGNFTAIGTSATADLDKAPNFFNRDDRISTNNSLLRNISQINDFDLKLRGALTDTAAANLYAVGGNFLSWMGTADDYSVFTRPDSKFTGLTDRAAMWFAYMDWGIGRGNLRFGRQPLQWTPYLLKMIDVDSYTNIEYTDNGDYPVDGARLQYNFGGVKLDAFASKNNQNTFLAHGLTSQPTSGLYNDVLGVDFPGAVGLPTPGPLAVIASPFNVVGGHAAGGLTSIDQSAGARLQIGTPFAGNLGLSYLQGAGPVTVAPTGGTFDQFRAFGADLNLKLSSFLIAAQWNRSETLGTGATSDVNDENEAMEGKVGFGLGSLGIDAGWRRIERNYTAPGFWDKLGRWTNPSNVEGPFVGLTYAIKPNLNLIADGAFYSGVETFGDLPNVINDTDDNIIHAQAGLKWGLSPANSVSLGAEWVRWEPSEATADNSDEIYYNIGWGYQINPSAGFSLSYQIADYNAHGAIIPYSAGAHGGYEGNTAVAQFGVKF